jgi:tetratricopeptide (TPR) repeat protein
MNQLITWRQKPAEKNYLLSIGRARLHNNNGVAQLEKGNYEQALQDIRIAAQFLYYARKSLKQMKIPRTSTMQSQYCRQAFICISTQNEFVCSNAFLLEQSDEPISSCIIESASVLLNMALCYHINSLESKSIFNSSSNAVQLYKMAYNLSIQCHDDIRRHNLILMSLNNLGQLMYDTGEFDLSRLYFEELTCKVIRLLQANDSSMIANGQDFLINALVLRSLLSCAAAA